jgi:hypothetical protein
VLQLTTRRLYLFFSGRIFFQFCNDWCLYFDTTDGYLRFISTVGQTTVPFFPVVIFSGCNLNPPKNIAGQTTVPFFPVVIFSGHKYNNWCLCRNTNTNYDPKKLRPEKKGTVIWPAMFFKPPMMEPFAGPSSMAMGNQPMPLRSFRS